jgi:hypothetical protein
MKCWVLGWSEGEWEAFNNNLFGNDIVILFNNYYIKNYLLSRLYMIFMHFVSIAS